MLAFGPTASQQQKWIIIFENFEQTMQLMRDRNFPEYYAAPASRKSTDIFCTIIGAILAIGMFVTANIMWDSNIFHKKFASYYGTTSQSVCQPGQHILYQHPQDIKQYSCVEICPATYTNTNGICLPIYDTYRQRYLDNPEISTMVYGNQFPQVILYTVIISLGLGFLNLFIVNIAPRLSARLGFYCSMALLITVGVLLLVLYDRFWRQQTSLKIIVAVLCFFISIWIVIMICMFSNEIKIYGIFLEYAVMFLSKRMTTYFYIPIFFLAMLGFVTLIVWQHFCFASKMGDSKNLFNFNSGIWDVLNILEFFWGLQFLRDAFNFCVGGNAVDWYWHRESGNCLSSFKRLVCHNWGSVVGGSFINAFFQIPNIIFELFRCHPDTICSKTGNTCFHSCGRCSNFFDMIRTDAYSYINISGLQYCQAGQKCRKLCSTTNTFVGFQSPMKHYRLITHILHVSAAFLMSWFIQRYRMEYYGIWNNAVVIITSLLVITWFISIFSDVAEAFLTCYLLERDIEPNYNKMTGLSQEFKEDLHHHEKRMRKDGTC